MNRLSLFWTVACLLLGHSQVRGQHQWHFKPMLGIGADAEMYLAGPVIQLGSGINFGKKFSVDGEYSGHFAKKNAPAFDPSLRARWRQHTMAVVATFYLGRRKHQGFYMGTGPAIQYRNYWLEDNFGPYTDRRFIFTWSLRMGQAFKIKANSRQSFLLEANFIGPLYGRDSTGDLGEVFTQLSFNVGYRIDLKRGQKNANPAPTLHHP